MRIGIDWRFRLRICYFDSGSKAERAELGKDIVLQGLPLKKLGASKLAASRICRAPKTKHIKHGLPNNGLRCNKGLRKHSTQGFLTKPSAT